MGMLSMIYNAAARISTGVGIVSSKGNTNEANLSNIEARVNALSAHLSQHIGALSEYDVNRQSDTLESIDRDLAKIPVCALMTGDAKKLSNVQKRIHFLFSALNSKKRLDMVDMITYDLRKSQNTSRVVKELVSRTNKLYKALGKNGIKADLALKELNEIQHLFKHVFARVRRQDKRQLLVRLNEILILIVTNAHTNPNQAPKKGSDDILKHGVENIGNTCYINSIRALMKESGLIDDANIPSSLSAFKKEQPSAKSLKSAMGSLNPEYKTFQQQDAMEAMIQMMGKIDLHNQKTGVMLSIYNFFKFIASLFVSIHTKYNPLSAPMTTTRTYDVSKVPENLKAQARKTVITENESIHAIGMSRSTKAYDVQTLLNGYFSLKGEDAYFEAKDGTKHPRRGLKCERTFTEPPKHFVMSFNRFYFDRITGTRGKIDQDINGLDEYLQVSGKHFDTKQEMKYERSSAIIHHGTANGGHYYAIVKAQDGKYYKFNDSTVTEVTRSYADNEFKKAYIVYYKS
ncbi:hypothetical protein COB11_04595 [Candidatus Aerophobetes bacterium]|uniref:USP domain-containing protein n=1 Tax=Aerophobetes bacterium TaxID=2030807 RepID=A0A2A4YHG7_UNCAE|nr:MAG: hypothetical protein COB11_04595 [Candidatus Aerophobetes bacterium]